MARQPLVLDDFDHRLLDLLQRDASRTLTALGDAVGLSASAVQRRLGHYRRNGLLREVAVLDPAALPATTLVAVLVTMERDQPAPARRIPGAHARRSRGPAVLCARRRLGLSGDPGGQQRGRITARSAERLFVDEGNVKRYDTRLVFDAVKVGLQLPTRVPAKRKR